MIPFRYSTSAPIRSLPRLLKAYHAHGGSIVEYKRVVSCFILAQKSSHYVWVPPNGSPFLRSLPDTVITFLLGWWSIFGFFWTIEALTTNLAGGRDATDELLEATCGGDVALAQQLIDEEVRARRRQSIRAILLFLGIVGGTTLVFWGIERVVTWYMLRPAIQQPAAARSLAPPTVPATNLTIQPRAGTRLQAIFYNRNGRSTAIVDGKTLPVGGSVNGYTVLAIERQTVTLQSPKGERLILRVAN